MMIEFGEWRIRNFRPEDAAAIAKYANNRNVWRNLRDRFPHPYNLRHAEAWIDLVAAQKPETNFAIASATEAIGGIGLELAP